MMREIKFRAWDRARQIMADVTYINFEANIVGYAYRDGSTVISSEQVELMQYTGLHDKNGREIYEGDILDIGLLDQDGKPVVAPVSYEAYLAGYVLDNRGYGIWQRLGGDCEVVGNIFENPELLEAGK